MLRSGRQQMCRLCTWQSRFVGPSRLPGADFLVSNLIFQGFFPWATSTLPIGISAIDSRRQNRDGLHVLPCNTRTGDHESSVNLSDDEVVYLEIYKEFRVQQPLGRNAVGVVRNSDSKEHLKKRRIQALELDDLAGLHTQYQLPSKGSSVCELRFKGM